MISSVWSSYGHRFIGEDDHEACLTCGALYDLVATPEGSSDGAYVAANGDEPKQCTGDTSMVHGDPRETGHSLDCEGGCEHCSHDCNCVMCA